MTNRRIDRLCRAVLPAEFERVSRQAPEIQRFLEQNGWQDDLVSPPSNLKEAQPKDRDKINKKEYRKRRSEIIRQRSKSVNPIEQKIAQIENDIEVQENQLHHLNESMQQATQDQNGARISEISRNIHDCRNAIDRYFEKLETLTISLEKHQRKFDEKLKELEEILDIS